MQGSGDHMAGCNVFAPCHFSMGAKRCTQQNCGNAKKGGADTPFFSLAGDRIHQRTSNQPTTERRPRRGRSRRRPLAAAVQA